MFKDGSIEGVIVNDLKKISDRRGWLMELFRHDELAENDYPAMAYISMTEPGIARGPHEHEEQSDLFCFLGPSDFKLYLWDNRKNSPTYLFKTTLVLGESKPASVIIPPGVAHGYKNVGNKEGMVFNCANRLYAGKNKKERVDEIRHEEDPDTPFKLD
ncbi:dTDP-4-dehydrorhamnose 3,5-epimerase family protein [bacterium]|nr:dTDP-4-dehydrorhamnose 3,5-epimerase family protein [bacterium]